MEAAFPETADIETSSDNYARRFAGPIGAWFLQVQEAATIRMLAPYPRARILDVGGGHGQLTSALVQNQHQVTVFGSSEICRARIQHFVDEGSCAFQTGNILELPYPDRAFDVVISYRLLPHVTQWQRFLSELTRVADKAVLVDYPSTRSVNYLAPYLFRFKKRFEGNTRPFTCFNEPELYGIFKTLGFVPAERYAEFFLPMVIYRTIEAPRLAAGLEKGFRLLGLTKVLGSPIILKLTRAEKSANADLISSTSAILSEPWHANRD